MKKLSTLLLIAAVAAGIDANSAEVTRIAAGDHTMLLTKDGKIYVSGKNDAGQLGDGHYYDSEVSDNHYNATTFKPVEKDGVKFRSVTATLYNSYAIASDGALYAWGQNAYGQLGLGDDNNRAELSKVDFNPEEGAVAEIATDSAVKVYPTVAEETITVSSDATISSVSIYNANGQKVGFKMVDGTQTSLNVSHLAAGTYFVATESDAGKSVTRFIKK